jgi:hypothetical protein
MKKLTKKQNAALEFQLSFDDLLYRKYLELMDRVHLEAKRLIHEPMRIRRVVGMRGNDAIRLCVENINTTPEGTEIVVRL